ncbi:MAG TPA: MBL fold metallo-hydrolase, partial [Elusimicrobiales bacterium]|nr:MBL fold metallo-hydrolase [Elusimicrobiales bacterium]
MALRALLTLLLVSALFPSAGLCAGTAFLSLSSEAGEAGVQTAPVPLATSGRRDLRAYFIDVGQGDSEYIELPNGQNVLIDGGPPDPDGAAVPPIAKFLKEHKVDRIDHMVLTHPHSDHYAGLAYVADRMKIANFYDTRVDNTGAAGDDALREKVRSSGAKILYPAAGDTLEWAPGEVRVNVLNGCPESTQTAVGQLLNNCSIVLKITYQDASILYAGDVQDDVETGLVSRFGGELKADVLKVGHHGSSHSSSKPFLERIRPSSAFIEVGADNPYWHPAPSVINRLIEAGVASEQIYRTDRDGT